MKLLPLSVIDATYRDVPAPALFPEFLKLVAGRQAMITFANHYSFGYLSRSLLHAPQGIPIYCFLDGIALVLHLSFLKRNRSFYRASFDETSLAPEFFRFLSANRHSLFVIGGTDNQVRFFIDKCLRKHPSLIVIGFSAGYLTPSDYESIQAKIAKLNPSFLLVGMGPGLQERFILETFELGYSGVAITCGGYITQESATSKTYYPSLFNALNLRWLYRIIREPRRLFFRYSIDYPIQFAKITIQSFFQ